MAGLTPEEQHFFDNGGDTSQLTPDPGVQGVQDLAPSSTPPTTDFSQVDLAGLGNVDPAPQVPDPAPPVIAPPVIQAPVLPDVTELLRRSLAEAQQQSANLQAQLAAATAAKQVPTIQAPDPDTDPLGSMLHQLDQVNKNVAALQLDLANQQNQTTQMAAFQRFQQQVVGLRDAFKLTAPDFDAAYSHLREARMTDLRTFGIPETDIAKQIFQEEVVLSEAALKMGKNPAESIYEMAKRHGYQAGIQPAVTPQGTPPVAKAAPPANKLAAIQAAAAANAAQPNLPRTPGNEEFTLESLRDASDADLNKLVTDPNAWAKIAGSSNIPL